MTTQRKSSDSTVERQRPASSVGSREPPSDVGPIAGCGKIDAGILVENRLSISRIRREPVKMHTTLVIRLVDSVKPRVNDYRQMGVDVEQAYNLLSLSSSVDVQARYASLSYRLQCPFDNLCIDGLPGWEAVVRRPVCGFND